MLSLRLMRCWHLRSYFVGFAQWGWFCHLRACENPTPHLLCVVGWPAPTLSLSGVLEGGEFWKCVFLGICASQEGLSVHGNISSAFNWPGRGCSLECGAYATLELLLQYNTCTEISWLLMTARLGLADFFGPKFLLLPRATLKTPRRTCLSYQSVLEHGDCCRDSEYWCLQKLCRGVQNYLNFLPEHRWLYFPFSSL